MTIQEQNEKVSLWLEQYARRPLMQDKDARPLLLVKDDHNAAALVQKMNELYPGQALTLQRCIDLIKSEFSKQLHWILDPNYKPAAPPTPPVPAPVTPTDTRTKTQKLQDAGITPITHKASEADQKAEVARHKAEREKLQAIFMGDPKRTEFDDALRDANAILISTGPGTISRVKSYAAREEARQQIRLKWPQFAHLAQQPASERLDHKPGVF